ncbi:hypothetical protein IQK56_09445 [Pseudomonas sp. MAFF 301449]|uniref:Fe2OG dioxygenase domain-containing protein n=1 Tax=Pseudomonas cyclaminis TaxID=2781239 RepID=A0ABR9SQF8_9PSED|nr:hypothetical protein [Pseudomonas cyclaminis]MBE8591137.1 hypothetical protein [Pseudomonas cyclaminis]MBE8602920.1 hypothetical protein [Pseudomonas cyclaminis]VVM74235.1 hypothetical protein PS664_01953 [Pseudomonas fluorescens]
MFDINKHQHDFFYNLATVIDGLVPDDLCDALAARVNGIIAQQGVDWVKHESLGTDAVSDLGGAYNHFIFKGDDIRRHLPELTAVYHSLVPLVSLVTHTDTVVSPYPLSDINIKAYPPGGGTLGLHYDTNGITVLLFLTTNREAPLRMQIERTHPSKKEPWVEHNRIHAKKGSLLIMQGRKTLHDSEPTLTEQKLSVVYNYYERHDTYRHEDFDNFVYHGIKPKALEGRAE